MQTDSRIQFHLGGKVDMAKWLRRIRGAVGMGVAWAVAWFSAGMALFFVVGPDAADVPFPLGFGALGFLAGVTFSGVLGVVEGRRRFEELSLPRFALWGGVGGVLFSGVFVLAASLGADAFLVLGPVFSLAGAGSAAGSLALARKAVGGPPLPPGSETPLPPGPE